MNAAQECHIRVAQADIKETDLLPQQHREPFAEHSAAPLLHHCSVPQQSSVHGQNCAGMVLPENSTAQVMLPLSTHSPLPASCCQTRTGLHRDMQLFTSSDSGIPALEILSTTQTSSSCLGAYQLSTYYH